MTTSLLIAGFGGQGILFAGKAVARAALAAGRHTTFYPSYGPEMRGGTANCTVIVADETIGAPIVSAPDALIASNGPSLERFGGRVRPGGVVVVNASRVPEASVRSDVTTVAVAADDVARDLGDERVANLVLLGALSAVCDAGVPDLGQVLSDVLAEVLASHPAALATNRAALARGAAAARVRGDGSAG
jgi:2-oxoglutarate ferredoxin oxidoreductase subunit gamma